MIILTIDPQNIDWDSINLAAQALSRGELVIFPTETVYGLAADALNEAAIAKVFEAKTRDIGKPLPVQVADIESLHLVASSISRPAQILANKYWPGPLTLILPKSDSIPEIVTAGKASVGVRIPDHSVALALLKVFGGPIVASSANISDQQSATDAQSAAHELGDRVSVVLDSGPCSIGVASTVVDVSDGRIRVLRAGTISEQDIINTLEDNE